MKTSCTKQKDNKVKVKVEFSKDEVNNAISVKYAELSRKYKFPGFRPGKAPRPVVDNLVGKGGVELQATDDIVNNNVPKAIDAENLYTVGQPDFKDTKIDVIKQGQPFSFEFIIEVEPEFDLSNYNEVEISLPEDKATDKEIDAQIDQFREHYFAYEDASASTKADDQATLKLNIETKDDDGKTVDSLTNKALNYHLGSKFLPEEFEKKLIGSKKGDKLEFSIKMPKEPTVYTTSLVDRTKNLKFKIAVDAIQTKVLPTVNDEWVKTNMGFETVAELREQIAEQIVNEKARMIPLLKENKALAQIAERIKGDVPEAFAERKEVELMQDFFQQLQNQGMTFDAYLAQYGLTADKFKEDVKKQARDVAAQDIALDAYARNKNIQATDDEVLDEFKHGDPENWKNLYKDWQKRGEIHNIRRAIIRMKAAKALVENAKVTIEKEPGAKDSKSGKAGAKSGASTKSSAKSGAKSGASTKAPAKKAAAKKPAAKKTSTKK